MTGEEDGRPPLRFRADDVSHLLGPAGVETRRGFVEDEQVGVAHERHPEGEALAHPLGVAAGAPVGVAFEADPFEDGVGVRLLEDAFRSHGELDVFAPGEAVVDVVPLREHARSIADGDALVLGVHPEDANRPVGRADEVEEHVDRRRFPRAVRSEEAEHSAFGDREVEVPDGGHVAEPLCHPVEVDCGHRGSLYQSRLKGLGVGTTVVCSGVRDAGLTIDNGARLFFSAIPESAARRV